LSRKPTVAADLRSAGFRGGIREELPLAPLTTWKIGGPAELLAEPADVDDLGLAVEWALERGLPWRNLGNGSNLLVRDSGVRGMVVRIRKCLDEIEFDNETVVAGAGAMFPVVARLAASKGLAGIEFGAGIPGTIGGAIVMNAGWHEFEIGNVVHRVHHLSPQGVRSEISAPDCVFRYRGSAFRGRPGIVLATELALTPGRADEITARLEAFAASRKENQPTELPSCGSVFLKPPGDFAGRLIEAAGLKGHRVGAIEVSPQHANFFVNRGGGTAAQVLELVEHVEAVVKDRFDVSLTREFEFW